MPVVWSSLYMLVYLFFPTNLLYRYSRSMREFLCNTKHPQKLIWSLNQTHSLSSDDLIRLLCGFQPDSILNVASYYNFLARLWQAPKQNHLKLRKFKRKPSKKYKSNTKLPNRKVGVVNRLCKALESGKIPDIRPESVLQLLLKHAVVDTSARLGILGHNTDLSIAMDGSPFYAGSSSYGVRICDCKAKGIHQCSCARKYSDIDAQWGWDSYREVWFYGDSLFSVTACDSHFDLPIFLQSAQASRHDGVSAVRYVLQMYPDLKPTRFLADGAMDDHSVYKMVLNHGISRLSLCQKTQGILFWTIIRKSKNLTKLDIHSAATAFLGHILGSIPRSSGTNTDALMLLLKRKFPTALPALNAIKPKAHTDQLSI